MRLHLSILVVGLALGLAIGCGSVSSTSDGGGGKGGSGTGGSVGQGGARGGAGGGAGGSCAACQSGAATACPAGVSAGALCSGTLQTCCASDVEFQCGCNTMNCAWSPICGNTGGTGGTGNGGTLGSGGNQGTDGGMTCSPACTSGFICVASGTEGGAIINANDAGVCPSGTHPTGFENRCENNLAYGCMPIPTACGGTVTCTCAAALCTPPGVCMGPTNGVLSCILEAP